LGLLKRVDGNVDAEWGTEKYSLTTVASEYLDPTGQFYLGNLFEMEYRNYLTPQGLVDVMKSGKPKAAGGDIWEAVETSYEETKSFIMSMHSISARPAEALSRMFPFGNYKCILDIGGGSGVYPVFILKKHPHMKAIMADLKNVCKVAEEVFKSNSVSDRAKTAPLDMFKDPLPTQFDASTPVDIIFFSQILHDWTVDVATKLLRRAYEVLPKGGVLIVNEKLLDDKRSSPSETAMCSVSMLFWTEGQQFTHKKLKEMMLQVGFHDPQKVDTVGYWSFVWATK